MTMILDLKFSIGSFIQLDFCKVYGQTIGQFASAKPTLIENPELLRLQHNGGNIRSLNYWGKKLGEYLNISCSIMIFCL